MLEYRQPSACLSSMEIEEARKDPTIMHFVTLFCMSRPWYKNAKGPFFDEWRLYKSKTPWKDCPERNPQKGKFQKIGATLYKFAPHSVSLTILGFLHARVKPFVMR